MPTYEYKCDACGHTFEKYQSITASPIRKCPKCGKSRVKRLIGTGAGLLFKGSGFYITDYRSDSYKNAAKSDSGAPAKTDGESKPAAEPAKTAATSESGSTAAPAPALAAKPAAEKPASSAKRKSAK